MHVPRRRAGCIPLPRGVHIIAPLALIAGTPEATRHARPELHTCRPALLLPRVRSNLAGTARTSRPNFTPSLSRPLLTSSSRPSAPVGAGRIPHPTLCSHFTRLYFLVTRHAQLGLRSRRSRPQICNLRAHEKQTGTLSRNFVPVAPSAPSPSR